MKKLSFIMLLIYFVIIPFCYAENYYGDIKIFLENDGSASINGNTNYPYFLNISNSQKFTSKEAEYWTLNISSIELFESYVFELNLPANSEINYIKTTPKFRIDTSGDNIKIIGFGENKPFTLIVQYKINSSNSFFSEKNLLLIIIIVFILSLIIMIIVAYGILKKLKVNLSLKEEIDYLKKKALSIKEKKFHYIREKEKKELIKNDLIKIDLNKFTSRQQEIIKLLIEKEKMSQKELEKILNIPKSSISRNVNSLVSKGIVIKEQTGITNNLSLKKIENN